MTNLLAWTCWPRVVAFGHATGPGHDPPTSPADTFTATYPPVSRPDADGVGPRSWRLT